MREQVSRYLNDYETFHLFGASHWISIILFFLVVFFLPFIAKKFFSQSLQSSIGYLLVFFVFINFPIWALLEIIAGSFDLKLHLPLHLCRLANLLLPFALYNKDNTLFQVLFYWGLSAMFQAIFTPDITHDFPHFHYFRFIAAHHLLVITIIYYVVVFDFKPTISGLKSAFIALNVFLIIALIFNVIFESNYFWLIDKPPAGSLLDLMGPWPWYILVGEFVALIHFYAAYFLYYTLNTRFKVK
tara:strand:+ start:240 stop:968 length:729 start_codon:yes stop_codon:yes gene_type:complete